MYKLRHQTFSFEVTYYGVITSSDIWNNNNKNLSKSDTFFFFFLSHLMQIGVIFIRI